MFNSLFGKAELVFDPALGDPLGKIILREARQGKLETFNQKVDSLRSGEWDRRAFYVDLVGRDLVDTTDLEKLSDTPLANLLRGYVAIRTAWKARGSGDAVTVTDEGAKIFFRDLDKAARYLLRALEQDSEDPTPLAFLQTVAYGLQLDRKTADTWFDEAIQRDPTNQQAYYGHLIYLSKKWGGSHEEMYAFARSTLEKLPPRSTLASIIFLAFQEHYLFFLAFDKDIEGARTFLRNESVREESLRVYQGSLQQRKTIDRVSDYWPHNLAAWWFLMLNIPQIYRKETSKIGKCFTRFPWSMFYKDPAAAYQKALNV